MAEDTPLDELPPELVITLDPPISVKKGQEVSELRLREPTVGEIRKARSHIRASVNGETLTRYQTSLVASVAGVLEPVIEAMPISKLNEAMAYLDRFIEAGPQT